MSGINGAIDTALSGLIYFAAGINTVSENLANQNTAGYAVESASATTFVSQEGQPGIGVTAPQITRAANSFASGLLNAATSAASAASTSSAALTAISNALQNNGDVQSAINQLFNDIGTLAASPSSSGQRQTVLSDLQTVTGAFQSAATSLTDTQTEAGTSLTQNISQANALLDQLQGINKNLGTSPNDPNLLDQQQAALNSLSSLLNVNVLPQSDGQVIITAGGTTLLDQSGPQKLALVSNGVAAPTITAGASGIQVNATSTDGSIGGNLATYQSGAQALQALNTRAAILVQTVNTAQAQGLTLNGTQGGTLLSVPPPSVTANSANTGSATVSANITNPSQLPTDGGPFQITYNSITGWSAVDESTGQTYALGPGTTLNFAGFTVSVGGSPATGDKFVINPAPSAASGIAVTTAAPGDIAAADPYVASPGVLQNDGSVLNSNAGTITTGLDSVTNTPLTGAAIVPASYFGQDLQVTFTSPTAYNVTTSADPNTVIASGTLTNSTGTIAVAYPDGAAGGTYYQLPIGGTPDTGDSLTLTPGDASSGSNASRLAALYTTTNGTTDGTLQQSFIGFAAALGANAEQAQQASTAAATQVTTATDNLNSVSGVNSDQQAVILTTYQQAYQAAAQVISTAHGLFESLLQAVQ